MAIHYCTLVYRNKKKAKAKQMIQPTSTPYNLNLKKDHVDGI
jgi:hypothetical protein